jgi:hypothetical protein
MPKIPNSMWLQKNLFYELWKFIIRNKYMAQALFPGKLKF